MIVYSKYSNDRRPELMIRTDIVKEADGTKFVQKCAVSPAAAAHVEGLLDRYEALSRLYEGTRFLANKARRTENGIAFEFLEGQNLGDMAGAMNENDEALKALFSDYLAEVKKTADTSFAMTEDFAEVFGPAEAFAGRPAVSAANIDMILANIVVDGDRWHVIDYEWTFLFPVPVAYILWRIVHYFIGTDMMLEQRIGETLYEMAGLSPEDRALCDAMERRFQAYVDGSHKPLRMLYPDISYGFRPFGQLMNPAVTGVCSVKMETAAESIFEAPVGDGAVMCDSDENGSFVLLLDGARDRMVRLTFDEKPRAVIIDSLKVDGADSRDIQILSHAAVLAGRMAVLVGDKTDLAFTGWPMNARRVEIHFHVEQFTAPTVYHLGALMRDQLVGYAEQNAALLADRKKLNERIRFDEDQLEIRSEAALALSQTKLMKGYGKLKGGLSGVWSQLRPELPLEGSDIHYHIDETQTEGQDLVLKGWVLNKAFGREKLRITTGDGEPLGISVTRHDRPDVIAALSGDPFLSPGFEIRVSGGAGRKGLMLEIEDPRGHVRVPLS
ncbi:MAG: hypothetical protein Q4B73_02135 [Lachnospiraceae bacterium]|nr:hypothetical protein [Lachnospiraceae bacterium]